MWQFIQQAGPIGYILTGISVLSLGVILERIWFWLTRGKGLGGETRAEVLAAVSAGDFQQAEEILQENSGPESEALQYVLNHRDAPGDHALDVALSKETTLGGRWLSILDVNSAIAPMLGILGTVIGIIQAFQGMKGATPDTGLMVSGLSVSMLTTAIGLVVALLSVIPYNIFSRKAYHVQIRIAELLNEYKLFAASVNESVKSKSEETEC